MAARAADCKEVQFCNENNWVHFGHEISYRLTWNNVNTLATGINNCLKLHELIAKLIKVLAKTIEPQNKYLNTWKYEAKCKYSNRFHTNVGKFLASSLKYNLITKSPGRTATNS